MENKQMKSDFSMIDVGPKAATHRRAVASGRFFAKAETIERIRKKTLPKGDVLTLAEVAGIQGAKLTSTLLPLCHPLSLDSVRVALEVGSDRVEVKCEVKAFAKTGVEMEALAGVQTALLCLYDLTKGIDPILKIGDILLETKEGGKSGNWKNPHLAGTSLQTTEASRVTEKYNSLTVDVITLSDRASKKEYQDESGKKIAQWFESRGAHVTSRELIADDSLALSALLIAQLKQKPSLIVTTGGTGVSQRDISPETIQKVSDEFGGRLIAGFGELLRQEGAHKTPMSWLSRSEGYQIFGSVVLCLPGNPKAVIEGLDTLEHLLIHAVETSKGAGH